MKNLKFILIALLMLLTSTFSYAQKDSIAQQREARKYVREGNKLYLQKNFTDASVAYKKALEKNSSYKKASYNLGNALYKDKNYKEAIPQFNLTVESSKNKLEKSEGYHNIGNAMMQQKNYKGAIDAYKNSLRNNPGDDESRYNLAVAQKLQKDEENKEKGDDKNKDKDKKDQKKDQNKDKKDGDDKDKKDPKKDGDKGDDKKKQDPKKNDKSRQKPQPGKMSPQQIKQLLESLNNEEKKTQKKLNAKKAKGKKVKQEKDW